MELSKSAVVPCQKTAELLFLELRNAPTSSTECSFPQSVVSLPVAGCRPSGSQAWCQAVGLSHSPSSVPPGAGKSGEPQRA
ncbi:hypothetical protein P4O66_004279 [Electrophorus voltai]|uniref:Uncharacterized protein n=1 Tax=Electrophorus voltai TaxID=2609070 RepID=A0AAD9E2D8_9TELE|nr:hypothetical protein P4O66_004279 [Electrophorus voltai]